MPQINMDILIRVLPAIWLVIFLTLLILILVGQYRQNKRFQRRLDQHERLMMDALTELRWMTVTREEYAAQWQALSQQIVTESHELSRSQEARFDAADARIERAAEAQDIRSSRLSQTVEQKLSALTAQVTAQQAQQSTQISDMRTVLDRNVTALREENSRKLDEMRQVVDEKLHQTLEKRLTESFRLVSAQLETVAKGLGEMRTLANGVGDLKNVLTNVKTRGIWGEVQLGALLRQFMASSQYAENVEISPGSGQRVEFAVRLPGQDDQPVYLPIDSKFPMDAYEHLRAVSETGDTAAIQAAEKGMRDALMTEAKRISTKYIVPPYSTDFAVMFLPTEGLYAEALRAPGLAEEMQTRWHVLPAGPTTLTALLNSLQVGFRTLAVEKRSVEVWKAVATLRADFGRFHELLEATQNRLRQAAESLDKAAQRTRTIETHLRQAQEDPVAEAPQNQPLTGQQTLFSLPPEHISEDDHDQ